MFRISGSTKVNALFFSQSKRGTPEDPTRLWRPRNILSEILYSLGLPQDDLQLEKQAY